MTTADHEEVELKLRAQGPAPLRRLARASRLGPARLGPSATVDELDRYLDTPTRRLAGLRWACRLRTRGGRTIVSLKGPPVSAIHGALHRRPEHEGPASAALDPAAWPPSHARDLLLGLAAGEVLGERLILRQRRTERAATVSGARVGTLSLDRVDARYDGHGPGRLYVVELELAAEHAHDSDLLSALAAALGSVDGLVPDPLTKLERAIEMAGASGIP